MVEKMKKTVRTGERGGGGGGAGGGRRRELSGGGGGGGLLLDVDLVERFVAVADRILELAVDGQSQFKAVVIDRTQAAQRLSDARPRRRTRRRRRFGRGGRGRRRGGGAGRRRTE